MSMINGAYLVKVRDAQDGDRFMVADELTEVDVRKQMPDDADRVLAAARSSFDQSQSKS